MITEVMDGIALNGASRTMSAAGRRRISLAQKARWAKAKGHAPKPKRTNVCVCQKEDRGGSTVKVGEGEEGGVDYREPGR